MGSITWQYAALGALAVVWLLLLTRRFGPHLRRGLRQRSGHRAQSPVWASILGWLLIALLVAAAAGGGLLWLLGWPMMPKQAAFSTTEMLDLLKIGLAVVAGFGGVVALAVNYRKQRVAEAAHVHALNQEERERTKLFNERFKVAAELLHGEQPGLRIAGVSAMASLADDWEAQRQMCVDTLIDTVKLAEADHAEVVNKIFRALRARLGTQLEACAWSPLNFDFSGVKFEGADFSGCRFEGEVIFDDAQFTGKRSSFERASFRGPLRFHNAMFTGTVADFRDARFAGRSAEFIGCEFTGTTLDLRGSELQSRRLHFDHCVFTSCEVRAENMILGTAAVRIVRSRLADSTLDFTDVMGPDDGRGSLGFLFVEKCALARCEVLLRPFDPEHHFVWWRDNTATGGTLVADPKPTTWLKVRGEEPEGLPTTSNQPQ